MKGGLWSGNGEREGVEAVMKGTERVEAPR